MRARSPAKAAQRSQRHRMHCQPRHERPLMPTLRRSCTTRSTPNTSATASKAQQDAAKRAAHEQTRVDIAQAETDARTRQTEAQAAARGEVTTARADWQHE